MYYANIPTFLKCQPDVPQNADIGIVGVPYSGGNWVERTQYLAPRAVRDFSMGFHRTIVHSKLTLLNYAEFVILVTRI